MISNITFGQYFPSDSLLHRLDPRFKIVLIITFVVSIFLCKSAVSLGFVVLFVFTLVLISRIPLKTFLGNIKPLIPIIILTIILNLFYIDGRELFHIWKLTVTDQGVKTSVFISVRIVCFIVVSSLLTYTTTPNALTSALEDLLGWMKYIKIDIHSLAMMMTIALRFIPLLVDEINKIMNAQKARGADLDSGGLIKKAKAMIPVLIPLFVSSFRRAYELANAMECRCYSGGKGRTKMKRYTTSVKDYVSLFVIVAAVAAIILLNRVLIIGGF